MKGDRRRVVGSVHDMMNVRVSNRAYGVSFLVRCSQRRVAGGLWLHGTPYLQLVDQFVDVDGRGRTHQESAVLALPRAQAESSRPSSGVRTTDHEYEH
jgi:hypothetical protein